MRSRSLILIFPWLLAADAQPASFSQCMQTVRTAVGPLAEAESDDAFVVIGPMDLGAHVYHSLENEIADAIPEETARPQFLVQLSDGSGARWPELSSLTEAALPADPVQLDLYDLCGVPLEPTPSVTPARIQLVGGMGTLPGALFLERLAQVRGADTDRAPAQVLLFSNPAITSTSPSIFRHLRTHFDFLAAESDVAAVPCNTYHFFHHRILRNEGSLPEDNDVPFAHRYVAWKAGGRIGRRLGDEGKAAINDKFVDIVQEVSDEVQRGVAGDPAHCVYVLGTELNDRGRLYANALESRDLTVCPLAEAQREQVRTAIKSVKAGKEKMGGAAFSEVIDALAAATPTDTQAHFILGCTEIPIGLAAAGVLEDGVQPTTQVGRRTYYDSVNILVQGVQERLEE